MHQRLGDILNEKGPTGAKINEAIARELTVVKKALDHQIGIAEPAYREYMQSFRDLSRPLNQADVIGEISGRAINPLTGNIKPERFAASLSDDVAASATGFKRAQMGRVMDPSQIKGLDDLKQDLARSVMMRDLGRGPGSDTAQKLAQMGFLREEGVPGLPHVLERNIVIANQIFEALGKRKNVDMRKQLANILLNPQETARVMSLAKRAPLPAQEIPPELAERLSMYARSLALPAAAGAGQ